MPCFSEMRRDAALAIAFGTRSTGNFSTSNQKSVTASLASVISPWPCHGSPSQKPRFSSPRIRLMRCRSADPDSFSGGSTRSNARRGPSPAADLFVELARAIGRIWPRHDCVQVLHDLPVREQDLCPVGVGEDSSRNSRRSVSSGGDVTRLSLYSAHHVAIEDHDGQRRTRRARRKKTFCGFCGLCVVHRCRARRAHSGRRVANAAARTCSW